MPKIWRCCAASRSQNPSNPSQRRLRYAGCGERGLTRHQPPEGLLTELQHLALELGCSDKFLVGIRQFLAVELDAAALDLAARFAAAGTDADGTEQVEGLRREVHLGQ